MMLSAALAVASLLSEQGSIYFWLSLATMTILSIIAFGKFFSFFLSTFVMAFSYTDPGHANSFYSMLLPLYTWIALIVLLITLYFKFPEYLGQKVDRPRGSFWDGFGGGDF